MRKLRKILMTASVAAFALAICAMLVGCGGGSALNDGLPEWADEAAIVQETQTVVEDFNARDYAAIAAKAEGIGLTADQLQSAGDAMLDNLGEFSDFGDVAFLNGDDGSGNIYATVIQIANYSNGNAQYTISFYEDGSLAGFFVK